MKRLHLLYTSLLTIAAALLSSCEMHDYNTGDGLLSLLTAEFVEAHADNDKLIDYVVTDEGQQLVLSEPTSGEWITKGDSIYRALLYYIPTGETRGAPVVETYSLQPVNTLKPIEQARMKEEMVTDPLSLETIWLSSSGRYINIGLQIKSGAAPTDESNHKLAMIITDTNPTTLTLFHDRGDMPEYYTRRVYFSVPTEGIGQQELKIRINTYEGVVEKWVK